MTNDRQLCQIMLKQLVALDGLVLMGLHVFLGTFGHPEKIQLLQPSTAQCFRLCDSVCHSEYIHRKIAGILNAGPLRHSEHSSCQNGALHANFTTNLSFSKNFTQIEC
jgi:hypothetical protein